MLKSSLRNTRAVHLVVLDNPNQQEDVKLYVPLPDCDCQCYDLGREDILRQVAHGIYDISTSLRVGL